MRCTQRKNSSGSNWETEQIILWRSQEDIQDVLRTRTNGLRLIPILCRIYVPSYAIHYVKFTTPVLFVHLHYFKYLSFSVSLFVLQFLQHLVKNTTKKTCWSRCGSFSHRALQFMRVISDRSWVCRKCFNSFLDTCNTVFNTSTDNHKVLSVLNSIFKLRGCASEIINSRNSIHW